MVAVVYRNEPHLRELVGRLRRVLDLVPDSEWRVVFVDDASDDGSFELIARLTTGDSRWTVLGLGEIAGAEAAARAGIGTLGDWPDAVVVLSADLQDPPERLPEMVACWRGGAERVRVRCASRPGLGRPFSADHPGDGIDYVLLGRSVLPLLRDRGFLEVLRTPDAGGGELFIGGNPRMTRRAGWPLRRRLRTWTALFGRRQEAVVARRGGGADRP